MVSDGPAKGDARGCTSSKRDTSDVWGDDESCSGGGTVAEDEVENARGQDGGVVDEGCKDYRDQLYLASYP